MKNTENGQLELNLQEESFSVGKNKSTCLTKCCFASHSWRLFYFGNLFIQRNCTVAQKKLQEIYGYDILYNCKHLPYRNHVFISLNFCYSET